MSLSTLYRCSKPVSLLLCVLVLFFIRVTVVYIVNLVVTVDDLFIVTGDAKSRRSGTVDKSAKADKKAPTPAKDKDKSGKMSKEVSYQIF